MRSLVRRPVPIRLAALLATGALALTACTSGSSDGASSASCPGAATTVPAPAGATTDLGTKPVITVPAAPAPTTLQVADVVTGKGATACAGDQLTVKYVGVTYADGTQFDASWDNGQDFPFPLGAGQVITGWDQGLQGMRVGGRRQLTIPSDLAYGSAGQGPIPPGAALVFVVDLVEVSKAA